MQRPIKFRAWHKKEKRIIFNGKPYFLLDISDGSIYRADIDDFSEDYELMQYTGLKDKNGKEIYEGDIFRNEYGQTFVVKFGLYSAGGLDYYASPAYGFYGEPIDREEDDDEEILRENYYGAGNKNEVIGNIYEHPQLLKENKE